MRWNGMLVVCLLTTATALAGVHIERQATLDRFLTDNPGAALYRNGDQVTRVYGVTFGYGSTPEESAATFVENYAAMLGVAPENLFPGNHFNDVLTQPVTYEPATGEYKFVLVYYAQYHDGIPVFRAELRALVRNEPGYPLVWVGSSLRDLGDFTVPADTLAAVPADLGPTAAAASVPDLVNFGPSEYVIWAGVGANTATPRLALKFEADNGLPATPDYQKWLFLVDAATGAMLYQEDQIVHTNVTGSVHGMATTGNKADACNPEVETAMPYARVSIGSTVAYADANGNFTIPNSGSSQVTVSSPMRGRYFRIYDQGGSLDDQTKSVTPPGPANFIHNSANTSEFVRSEVNCYIQANKVRDFALTQNPSYPTIGNQTEFTVNVNLNSTCNAYYDGSSINFYRSGGGCNNTGFSGVVHHEYGHHLVNVGGSEQSAYGEGMGDCMAMLIADDSVLGWGFRTCSSGIRDANNTFQYPCDGEIHYCGQLLSGCVWSTRTQLRNTNPSTYLQIISSLTVNSILLHTYAGINPAVTVDFLTLDDNDGNLLNGTPHYNEICTGFAAHSMDCPNGLTVTPGVPFEPQGQPGGPFTPTSVVYTLHNVGTYSFNYQVSKTQSWVTVSGASGSLAPGGTALVTVSVNSGANSLGFGYHYDTLTFTNTTNGVGNTTRAVNLRVGGPTKIYGWNLDTDPGWSLAGQWAWGPPTGGSGDHGGPDPTSGKTGTNVLGYNLNGGYTNNMARYSLIAGPIDCTGLTEITLRYWRWLGVDRYTSDKAEVSMSLDGSVWLLLWNNDSLSATDDQSWVYQKIDLSTTADNKPTVYIRWAMGPTDASSTYCGWNLDDIEIWATAPCNAPVITSQPQSQTACVGGFASFSVAASGTAPLNYQWRKNGSNLAGATSSSYLINPVTAGDAATYDCVVSNSCGSANSNPVTLSVNTAPTITTHPQSQSACAGGSAAFTVGASGSGTLSYQWRKNGGNIGGATGNSLTINPVTAGDAANYDCVVTNTCGSATSNAATLTVNTAPAISSHPQDQAVRVGQPAGFSVTATGTNPLYYQWRKGGENISGANSSSYVIDSVSVDDAGTYDCVVSNACGSAISGSATLTVYPLGDMNCDGLVNNQDIDHFVQALLDASRYVSDHDGDPYAPCDILNGDFNGDGAVNNQDIDAFVAALL